MPTWLAGLAAAVVLVGFLGTAVVYLRGSKDAGTIKTLEQNNQALTERVEKVLEPEVHRLTERVDFLEHENERLNAQRPSAEVLEQMYALLKEHAADLKHHDIETRPLLMAIASQLGEMRP